MTPPCRLKARRFTLSVLEISDAAIERLQACLAQLIAAGGDFMRHAPVVLDITAIETEGEHAVRTALDVARTHNLVPCGVICSDSAWQNFGRQLAVAQIAREPDAAAAADEHKGWAPAQVIQGPIRSGQQVYARNRDLIVLAPVSDGAEVIADGSIHVYSTLRGRAIAGASGREDAHIFARDFRAELIAIAGHYRVAEDQPRALQGGTVHARLEAGKLLVDTQPD